MTGTSSIPFEGFRALRGSNSIQPFTIDLLEHHGTRTPLPMYGCVCLGEGFVCVLAYVCLVWVYVYMGTCICSCVYSIMPYPPPFPPPSPPPPSLPSPPPLPPPLPPPPLPPLLPPSLPLFSAHTCFNRLDLPRYNSKADLQQKLTLAIEECESFENA